MKEPMTKKDNVPFTMVANKILTDKTLSWKAKGMWAYLYSKPDGWEFAVVRIEGDSSDGRDASISAIRELEEHGYLVRKRLTSGRFEYKISWKPITENPDLPFTENPIYGKSHLGKTRKLSNTEEESNTKEERKTDNATQGVAKANAVNPRTFFDPSRDKFDGVAMCLQEFVLMCRSSNLRFIRIIGEYADERKLLYLTRGQWREFGRRNLRVAKRLAPYNDRQIAGAMARMEDDYKAMMRRDGRLPKWGLETVEKYLEEGNNQ